MILCCLGCSRATIPPANVTDIAGTPDIYPDYTDIVIPPNIAPLNFEINIPGEEYGARAYLPDGREFTAGGKTVKWNLEEWHSLLDEAKGKKIDFEVFVKDAAGKWGRYRFSNTVAEEEIDPYVSYRLIEPLYTQYGSLSICQRDLTSWDEETVINTTTHTCL